MKKDKAFTLVELLVVIAIIAVLLAMLLPSLRHVKGMAQRLTCKTKLKDIGTSITTYSEQYDGLMPRSDHSDNPAVKHAYWALAIRNDLTQPAQYYGHGGLWKAGLVPDGREFYCPAVTNWLEEYLHYCDPRPWGTLPQVYNDTQPNQFLRTYKGFLYWPQTRKTATSADMASWKTAAGGASWVNSLYKEDYPGSPYRYADMSPSRSVSLDCSPHSIQGSGFNVNVLFGDNHVSLNMWPSNPVNKKFYFPYLWSNEDWGIMQNLDAPYNTGAKWESAVNAVYFSKFQP